MMTTIRMILMSEHSSDSISNRLAQPGMNTSQKKYITRLEGHNNTDQLCDRKSLLTALPESWSHKEPLHSRSGLIDHGDKIIPVIYVHKELYSSKTIEGNGTVENPIHAERSLHSFKTIKTPTSD